MSDVDAQSENKAVGLLVQGARSRLRMTQEELAGLSRVARQTVGNLELGVRSGKPFRTSAKVLAAVSYVVKLTPEQVEAVGRADAASVLRDLIERDLTAGEAERLRVETLVVNGLRGKRAEFTTVGEFLGWVLMVTGDVSGGDA